VVRQHGLLAAVGASSGAFRLAGACLVYALAQLAVAVPVYLVVLPRENERAKAD